MAGLGDKPPTKPAKVHQAQLRLTWALHEAKGTKLPADLKAQADNIE